MSKSIINKKLFQSVKTLIQQTQLFVVRKVNTTTLITYFEIGRMIDENEQQGKQRAEVKKFMLRQINATLQYNQSSHKKISLAIIKQS